MEKSILNYKDILIHNKKMIKKCGKLVDMYSFNVENYDLLTKIKSFNVEKPYFNDNKIIDKNIIENILLNRNIDNINIELKKGIIINRSNLRLLPTDLAFYNKPNDIIFDRLQETVLHIGMPIYILHISLDKNWYFIQSYFAYGWISKEDFVFVNNYEFNYFLNPNKFIIVTESLLNIENSYLDMSTKLPYIDEDKDYYKIILPKKFNNKLIYEYKLISKNFVSNKYLDFTYSNLINLFNEYIDFNYGWGGLNNGVDCTSLVANVFRCFGFMFPRNTSEQKNIVGKTVFNLNNFTKFEKINLLNNFGILYTKDHCLFYLGKINNKDYVIHAYSESSKVIKSTLDNTNNKDLYDEIIYYNLY